MTAPFQRHAFDDLPERPVRPHDYFDTALKRISMRSRPFGPIEIAYQERGSGPPLLLVHGLMTSSYSWRYVLSALAKTYRVIAPDLPGSGASGKPLVRYSAGAYAEWLAEFSNELGIRGAACIANSLGGYLAMRAVLADPALYSRLVNI